MNIKAAFVVAMLVVSFRAMAQQPGTVGYSFLNLPYAAKLGGLGGTNVSLLGNDPNFFLSNPALASDSLANRPAVNYTFFPNGIGLSSATYSKSFVKAGLWSAGVQYLSYGKIDSYDNTGVLIGSFIPNQYALTVSHVRMANNFRFGASLKFVGSDIAGYRGSASLFDLGGLFVHPSKPFTVGLTIKNLGFEWHSISDMVKTKLPFDVQVGASVKPEHMPFQFSLTLHQLHQWDLTIPNETLTNAFADNLMRHVVLGTELLLNQHIHLLFGYNHLRRRELRQESSAGFSGFSVGMNIRTKAFEIVYAYGGYHVAGSTNMFTLVVNMNQIIKKVN